MLNRTTTIQITMTAADPATRQRPYVTVALPRDALNRRMATRKPRPSQREVRGYSNGRSWPAVDDLNHNLQPIAQRSSPAMRRAAGRALMH